MRVLKWVAYTKVESSRVIPALTLRPHDQQVDTYLLNAVAELQRGADGSAPPATFTSGVARDDVERLRSPDKRTFLETARLLARQLVSNMDGRTKAGLLVFLSMEAEATVSAAVLKLEVVTEHAARLEELDNGEITLEAVTDVLEAPGELQKGMVYPDSREHSEVVVGDRLPVDALYFTQAFGVQTQERLGATASRLTQAINQVNPVAAREAVKQLASVDSGPVEEVLGGLVERGVELTPEQVADVTATLDGDRRPVREIRTSGSTRLVYSVQGIKLTVPASAVDFVRKTRTDDGWQIVITTAIEPHLTYEK